MAQRLPSLKPSSATELRSGGEAGVKLEFDPGWKVNETAPSWMAIFDGVSQKLLREYPRDTLRKGGTLPLPRLQAGKAYRLQGTVYFCEAKNSSVCVRQSHDQEIRAQATGEAELRIRFQSPK